MESCEGPEINPPIDKVKERRDQKESGPCSCQVLLRKGEMGVNLLHTKSKVCGQRCEDGKKKILKIRIHEEDLSRVFFIKEK